MKSEEKNNAVIVPIIQSEDIYQAIIETKSLSAKAGFNLIEQTLIATVASELATNIIRYAEKGEIHLCMKSIADNKCIELTAIDNGPGIENVEKAMEDNYTTFKNSLGMGLSSVKRIMDEFSIETEKNKGTRIFARKWIYKNED